MRKENVNLVPTSAISGCGVPDLLSLLTKLCQTRKMAKKLRFSPDLNCTIMEVTFLIFYSVILIQRL